MADDPVPPMRNGRLHVQPRPILALVPAAALDARRSIEHLTAVLAWVPRTGHPPLRGYPPTAWATPLSPQPSRHPQVELDVAMNVGTGAKLLE
jgi:hypothetical protein